MRYGLFKWASGFYEHQGGPSRRLRCGDRNLPRFVTPRRSARLSGRIQAGGWSKREHAFIAATAAINYACEVGEFLRLASDPLAS